VFGVICVIVCLVTNTKQMNDSPKFKDSRGKLTAYSFKCGYVESKVRNGIETDIWQDGGCSFYQVRRHDWNKGERVWWKDAKTLKAARKLANSID
jgi:hypothetical protein